MKHVPGLAWFRGRTICMLLLASSLALPALMTVDVAAQTTEQVCTTLEMSDGDCALISAVATRGSNWLISRVHPVHTGAGANLRSPLGVAHDAIACLDLAVNLPAGIRINFNWRTETEEDSDYFAFYLNDSIFARNSGLVGWHLLSFVSPEAITRLSWCYERDGSGGDPNEHNGRIDRLQFNVQSSPWAGFCNTLRLSDGGCAQVISVRNAADHPWQRVTGGATFSGQGYQSDSSLADNQESLLSVTLAPGVMGLEFHRRVSSELLNDWLIFEYDDNERGSVSEAGALVSLAPYRSLPFFDGAGTRVQGDLSGIRNNYIYGNIESANADINSGANGEWSLLRLLPTDGDITELRWIYRKDANDSEGSDRGWIDSLQLHPALTNNSQLCEALDLNEQSCSVVASFAQQPSTRLWTVDNGTMLAPTGGSALRVPLRVPNGEKACLSMSLVQPIAAGFTMAFSWRLNADSNSMLTFEVDGTVELMLAGDGSDSPWTMAFWTTAEAVDSFAWCYQGAEVTRAWVDDLELLALTNKSQLCEALDLNEQSCSTVASFAQQPSTRLWTVDDGTMLAPTGGSALRVPLRVPDSEKACLSLSLVQPIAAGFTMAFSWRLNADSNSMLTFEVDGTVELMLAGDGSDSGWTRASWHVPEAVDSFAWCYEGTDVTEAWVDGLALMALTTTSTVCAVLDMTAADCAMVSALNQSPDTLSWNVDTAVHRSGGSSLRSPSGVAHDARACLDLAVNLPAGSRINFHWRIETEENSDYFAFYINDSIVARNSGLIDWRLLSIASPAAITQLSWCYERDGSGGDPDDHNGRIDRLQFNVQSNPWAGFCNTLRLSDGDCAKVISVRNAADHPWVRVTGDETFSGQGYQSDPGLNDDEMSVLTVTLAAGVVGLEFYRRVTSERLWDWFIFEYDDTERGSVSATGALVSLTPYRSLPFFDGADTRVQGDLSGVSNRYTYGNLRSANADINSGANGEWSLLRLLPTDGDITDLRWIYRKDGGVSHYLDRGFIDSLQLYPALTDNSQLCSALDLTGSNCSAVRSFAEQPPARLWTVDDGITPAPAGGSALRVPLRVPNGEKNCLSLSRPIPIHHAVVFSWRLNAGSNSMLTFEVDNTVELTLRGNGSDSPWTTASWTATETIDSFSWCYEGVEVTRAWVDALRYVEPPLEIDIAAVTTAVLTETSADGQQLTYSLQVRVAALFYNLMAGEYDIALRYTGTDAARVTTLVVTGQTTAPEGDGALILAATLRLELQPLQNTVEIDLGLSGDEVGSQVLPLRLDVSAESLALICIALDIEQAGCELLSGFSTTASAPWQVTTASFQNGDSLLGSGAGLADDSESCLTLEFAAGSELPVAGRMDFLWAVDAAAGDGLQLRVGGTEIANFSGLGAGIITPHRQQRFAATAVSSLSWCYIKDSSGAEGADRSWVDELQLLQPPDATLLPATANDLCTVLDMTEADCAVISTLSQSPDTLNWDTSTATQRLGGSSLRTPQTVADGEMACLTLTLDSALPMGTGITFWWRVDSAAGSALELRLGGAALTPPVSISGLASEVTSNNGWQLRTAEATAELTSLGWCYSRVAGMFAGTEQGWVDNLQLYPAVATTMQLCETLDIDTDSCTELQSFAQQPPERVWTVDDSVTPTPAGGSALRLPFEVTEDEKTCLSLSLPVAAGQTVVFSWRLNAAAGSDLTFEADDTAELTLAGMSGDSGWTMASWTTAEAVDSFAWCYQGAEMTQAWVDALRILPDKQRFCSALRMSEADCALVELVDTSPGNPWEITTSTETLSGQGYQSAPGLPDGAESVLTVTLAAGVVGLEFHRRVSSEIGFDWLIFEYDDADRGPGIRADSGSGLLSLEPYRSLPFFDGAGTGVQGDLSGFGALFSYGDGLDDAGSDINLGDNNQWSLLRLLPTDGNITELRWIYRKDGNDSEGSDRAWIDSLRLHPAVTTTTQLCKALDLEAGQCNAVRSFAEQPPARMWTVDDSTALAAMGGSALRVPLRILVSEKACLSLTRPVAEGYTVMFFWRLNADSDTNLTFEVNDTVELTLTGDGSDSGWTTATWTVAEAVNSFSWCYEGTPVTQAWVSALSFDSSTQTLVAVTGVTPMLTDTEDEGQLGEYSLAVTVEPQSLFSVLNSDDYNLELTVAGADAGLVSTLVVTAQEQQGTGILLSATLRLELLNPQLLRDSVALELLLGGAPTASPDQGFALMLDVTAQMTMIICSALDMEQTDCELLSGFSTSAASPWQITTVSFRDGDNLLGSGTGVADDGESCLTLEFAAGSELPVAGRMDFLWAVDAAAGDGLQLRVGGTEIANFSGLGAGIITPHRQQRFAATAVSSLSWCYIKDSSGAEGADRGWVDELQLLQPPDATLLPATANDLCTVLDMTEADCAVISTLSQSPDTLNWDTSTATRRLGGSSLRTPQTVTDGEMACLTLALDSALPMGTGITFWWRVDSAAASALELRLGGAALTPPVTISGLASEVTSNNGWQLRIAEASAELTSLGWCYSRVAGMFAGTEQGWVDNLQLYPAVTTTTQLCETLDLDTDSCTELQSFAQQPPERVWTVDDSLTTTPAGGSALRLPFEVTEDEKTCLSLSLPVAAGYTVGFFWRLNAASGSDLTFEVGDTAELTLAGDGSDSSWTTASWTTAEAVDSFAWCYQGAEMTQAWIDGLSFTEPPLEIDIAAVTTVVLTESSADGQQLTYSLQVRVAAPFFTLTAGEYDIALLVTGTDAALVTILEVTTQTAIPEGGDGLILAATLRLELQQLRSSVEIDLGLSGDQVGSQVQPLILDVSAETLALICIALDMEQADCDLLGAFSTTESAPWQLATAAFQSGNNLLGSGSGVADDGESCLTLEFAAGSELPVAGRMDFLWAVDAATGDGLQLRINSTEIANFSGLGAGTITPHRQQRFATAAVSSVTWCYTRDASGTGGADRGWIDDLQLLQPLDATLLPATANDLCAVLDMTTADCSVISALSPSPDTLNWDTDSAVHRSGGSSLRTPQTVADGEMACLTLALQPNLPVGSRVAFWWRVDSAAASALELRLGGAALTPPVTISGLASEVTSNNGWQLHTGEASAELTSLGWCYSRVAGMFASTEQGWVDNLQLYPAVATTMQLCETLDLDTGSCTELQSFAEQPPERAWTVDDNLTPTPAGGSALRVPFEVTEDEKTCLSLSLPVAAGHTVAFSWRLNAALGTNLTFEVGDTAELTLAGDGSDSGWTTATWTTAEAVDSFTWCYQGAEMTQAWIDGLGFTEPPLEIDIAAVTTVVLTETSADGQQLTYSLQVRVAAPFFTLTAGEYDINLRFTGTDAALVTALEVTAQTAAPEGEDGLILAATLELELQQLRSSVEIDLGLGGDEVGSQVLPLRLDISAETLALICLTLDMEQADCELLGGFSTTESAPWQLATAAFQSGNNLLGSGTGIPDDGESCLTLEFAAGSELPVAGRMDFLWAVDAAAGDGLQLRVGGTDIAGFGGLGAGTITPHRQQRFATAAISSVTWCYTRDASGTGGADRGWIDDLQLLQPLDAALPPATTNDLCTVLDMTTADCSVISALSQSPDTLNWGTDSAVHRFGGSALRTPQTVADGEMACLTLALQPNLPVGSRVAFWWRVDSAAASALELRLGGAALTPPVSISGLASEVNSDNGWQLHTGEVTAELTALGWCYSRVAGMFAGTEQGWVDNLQLYPAVATTMQLCETLDLDTDSCTALQSFAQQPPERVWTVDDSLTPAPAGGSALRLPFEVTEDEKTCLSLSLPVAAGHTVVFSWRLNAASGTTLTFEVNDTAELTLAGDGTDSSWTTATWTTAEAVDSFAWCYQGAEMTQAWIDGLSFAEPPLEIDIAAVTAAVLTETSANGQQLTYSLQVRVAAPFFTLMAGTYDIALQVTGTDAALVTALEVTGQTATPEGEDGLILAATLTLELQPLQSTVKVNLGLSGDEVGSQVQPLMLDVSAETLALICLALDMEQADCDLLGAFSTTESAPWQLATAAFQSGNNLLGSGSGVPDDGESCLTLEFAAGSELPVAGRMDFLWAVDAATGDGLQLQINGTEIANFGGLGAGVITPHRQQRFATAAVSSLTWCYNRDASGTGGADRGWIDDLQLQQPVDAALTPATITAVCMVLDITEADCSVLGALSQSPDTLNWDTDSAVHLAGGNSLRTPQTVTDGEMACLTLTLEPTLPAGTEVAFRWRVDSAAASVLELRLNDAALTPPVTISGLASGVTNNNGWRMHTSEAAAELTSLGWCYSRVAGQFAGTERGWVEQLQLNPPFSAPLFTAGEVTRLANNGIQFDLQLRPGSGEAALPAGVVVLVRPDNLENVVLTTVTASATAVDYRVTATVMEANDIARLRFSTGPLPPALDAFPESAVFVLTIESQTPVDAAAMLLSRLSVEPPSASPGISINDLLLGLRLSAGEEVETVLTNLGVDNGDRTADMRQFEEFLADPEQSGAIDINRDDAVDTLDFRLMVRYLSGLRGEELLCSSLCEARLRRLFSQ